MTASAISTKLASAGAQLAQEGTATLQQLAEDAVRGAAARAPRDDGELAASQFVRMLPNGAELGFSARHAIIQHEDLTLQHDDGEAKFLERELMERKEGIQAALAAHLRATLGGA